MQKITTRDLTHDLILPVLLFAALGGMSWAVRGSSGFGGEAGCIYAGVLWGAAWWFISRESGAEQSRRYTSGWIILALTAGIGMSGFRGWMQWPSFFEGRLVTNYGQNEFVPISKAYGFLWLFIAGAPWAGIGACMLAWCGSRLPMRAWQWVLRIACGVGVAFLLRSLYNTFPQFFLPLYDSLADRYNDFEANPNLRRLVRDSRSAITHLGLFLGFLIFEIGRRDWKNVTLISTVGLLNGLGWALFQNWKWAAGLWPNASFNWWRCWESSGGISIGIAYGVAFFLVNRPRTSDEPALPGLAMPNAFPNLERFGAYLGLIVGLGLSIKNGLKGWANIYLGNEDYWDQQFWNVIGPALLIGIIILIVRLRRQPLEKGYLGDVFKHDYRLIWLVLIVQNVIAQMVTGPFKNWNEVVFNIYCHPLGEKPSPSGEVFR